MYKMRWVDALKQWNAHHKSVNTAHVWMVPRKGTAEHAEVKEIMERVKPANVEKENVARREKSIAQLREATKNMKPGRPPERDYEAENVARRATSIAQLREATKGMKPGVREDTAKIAEMWDLVSSGYGYDTALYKSLERVADRATPTKEQEEKFLYELKQVVKKIYSGMSEGFSGVIDWGRESKANVLRWFMDAVADVKPPSPYKLQLVPGNKLLAPPENGVFLVLQRGNAPLENRAVLNKQISSLKFNNPEDYPSDVYHRPGDRVYWRQLVPRLAMTAEKHRGESDRLEREYEEKKAAREKAVEDAEKAKKNARAKELRDKKKANPEKEATKKEAEAKSLAKAKESREKAESASSTEINQEMANRLPAEVVEGSIMPFLKGKEFNLANVFLSAPNMIRSRAVGVIALLEGLKSMKDDEWFVKADEFPKIDVSDPTLREFVSAMNTRSQFEVPSKEQKEIVQNGLPSYVSFDMYRRKGTMGNKSGVIFRPSVSTEGLNLRTKAGRDEKKAREDNVSKIAESYLQRIIAKAGAFAKFLNEKSESMEKARSTKKAEARSSVEFAKSKADAPYVMPDKFYDIAYAFMGDEGKARRYANDLSEKAKGRPVKFWLPRGKNLLASF
ncbi:MAG: hypothetical protein YSLV5_ORF08 [Yellowstone Lake virophage 5]|uniref:Uncharacterized protein n=1 Tax=Yellowstone Lake virophage 5 TaxID=1557033 RepID=A0A0A0RJS4_9VIRU|nr:MAG: hypothetical protein ASQ69_gp08 [Yellowstone Lake virophage 5]AIW01866.1 MAG: hypothetical protein YSLV5_ORF08 [Yellowstone Lake virophage 5]